MKTFLGLFFIGVFFVIFFPVMKILYKSLCDKIKTVFFLIILSLSIFSGCTKDNLTVDNPTQIMDIDGNIYHSVIIGDQEWLVENLKVTQLNDGTELKYVSSGTDWIVDKSPSYCWYDNIVDLESNNGLLYNFYSVNTGKLAPSGWRVASDDDWKTLELFIGMTEQEVDMKTWRGEGMSTVLKASDKWKVLGGNGDYYVF